MSAGDPPIYVCGCGQRPVMPVSVANDRPSRLERVAEALFVQAMTEWTKGVPNWQTSRKDLAATAIRGALAFEEVWKAHES